MSLTTLRSQSHMAVTQLLTLGDLLLSYLIFLISKVKRFFEYVSVCLSQNDHLKEYSPNVGKNVEH